MAHTSNVGLILEKSLGQEKRLKSKQETRPVAKFLNPKVKSFYMLWYSKIYWLCLILFLDYVEHQPYKSV